MGQVEHERVGGTEDREDGFSPDSHGHLGGYLDLLVGKVRLGEERSNKGVDLPEIK